MLTGCALGIFERFLSLWVVLVIVGGVSLGALFPAVAEALTALEFARINLLIALLIWGMIYLMMLAVDFSHWVDWGGNPRVWSSLW